MGAYKSRPTQVCADEFKRKLVDSYQFVCKKLDEECSSSQLDSVWKNCLEKDDVIEFLSSKDIDVNANLDNGTTPLHILSAHGTGQQVSALLESGSILNTYSRHEFTALHFATYLSKVDNVEVLSSKGADVSAQGTLGVTPLHLAALLGLSEIAAILVSRGAKLDFQDEVKFTPLHLACFYNNDEVVGELLRGGANVNMSGIVGDRPLHLACSRGHVNIVKRLLSTKDCEVDAKDNENNTALHYAARQAQVDIVKILLNYTTQPHAANIYGDTALHFACYSGGLQVAKSLVEQAGTDSVAAENIYSETPLHSACTNGQSIELVKYILDLGVVGINHQGQDKHTVLHSACYHGHLKLVEYLLDRGADSTLLADEKDGGDPQSCLRWAYEKGFDDILSLLKRKLRAEDSSSEGSGSDYNLQIPSPLGKIRSMVREKAEVQELRDRLPHHQHIMYGEIELLEPIGSGSFGKVFKGNCRNKVVAIKRYRASPFSAKSDVDMFCREVSILCRVKHPNIVKFIGACMEEPCQFAIVTEYVADGSLFANLHQQKIELSPTDIKIIAHDIAQGMAYLHRLKPVPVIHRDLNSHNILLADRRAIISDFGESRFIVMTESLTKQPGNLRWMAPEIFTQSTNYTVKADMFSYTLVLWELLAGELPFNHLKPAAAAADMAYRNVRPPINPAWPKNFCDLMARGWSEDSNERPTFTEVLQHYFPLDKTMIPIKTGAKGATPVKHPDSNGLSNGNNGVTLNGNGTAEGTSPHHSEREDMKFWENDHFTDLRKRWEKGEIEEGEIAELSYTNEEIKQLLDDNLQLPSVEELREKIQQGTLAASNGYIIDPYRTLDFIQNSNHSE